MTKIKFWPKARAAVRLSAKTVINAVFAAVLSAAPLSAVQAMDLPEDLNIDLDSLVVSKDELVCLALNDYWEARSEVTAGRIAVAKVVLNRAMDRRFPSNICDIVKQTRSGKLNRCQFSWYCDGKTDTPYNPVQWRNSLKIAAAVLQRDSSFVDPTDGALWYHADFVQPSWALGYESTTVIGTHVFYREPSRTRRANARVPFVERLNAFAEWRIARDEQRMRTVALR
ncbi:MAG: cell wall hydrolase [Rhodobacteraceae bacterium]|nr:cell wall hydrolase [Paracoccaceae bacterium]